VSNKSSQLREFYALFPQATTREAAEFVGCSVTLAVMVKQTRGKAKPSAPGKSAIELLERQRKLAISRRDASQVSLERAELELAELDKAIDELLSTSLQEGS
jgi:hypothetical protein